MGYELDLKLKDWVVNNDKETRKNNQRWFEKLKRWKKIYEVEDYQERYKRLEPGMANIHVPEIFKAIQTLKSRVMYYLNDWFDIRDASAPISVVDAYKRFIKEQHKQSNFYTELDKFVVSTMKNGTGIAKVYEDVRVEYTDVQVPEYAIDEETGEVMLDPEGQPVVVGVKTQDAVNIKRTPKFQNIDWHNISVVGNISDFKNADMVIETIENVSWDFLWSNRKRKITLEDGSQEEVGYYINLEKALKEKVKPELPSEIEERDLLDKYEYEQKDMIPVDKDKKDDPRNIKHVLKQAWGYYDLEGDGPIPVLVTVLDDKITIRREPNPFKHNKMPYLVCPFIVKDDDWRGIGVCDVTEDLQSELNAKRNQLLDNATQVLHSMKVVTDPNIPDSQLQTRPNGIIRSARGREAVVPLDVPLMNHQAGVITDTMIKDDMNTAVGSTKSMEGEPLNRGTATEVRALISEGNYRVMDFIRNLENYVLYPYINMHHELNRQYVENEIRVIEEAKKPGQPRYSEKVLHKQDIDFPFEFDVVVASAVENKTVKIQQLQNFMGVLAATGLPPQILAPGMVRLAKRIWSYMGIGNPDEIFPDNASQMMTTPEAQGPRGGVPNKESGVINQVRPRGVPNMEA